MTSKAKTISAEQVRVIRELGFDDLDDLLAEIGKVQRQGEDAGGPAEVNDKPIPSITLGRFPDPSDAVTGAGILAAPIVAGEDLLPGQRVVVTDGRAYAEPDQMAAEGVVDPFLVRPVLKDERFWFCMAPHRMTRLRDALNDQVWPAKKTTDPLGT